MKKLKAKINSALWDSRIPLNETEAIIKRAVLDTLLHYSILSFIAGAVIGTIIGKTQL